MEAQKVRNIVFQLKKLKRIESVARGIYKYIMQHVA